MIEFIYPNLSFWLNAIVRFYSIIFLVVDDVFIDIKPYMVTLLIYISYIF
jgi:hypothetical protein